MTVQELIDLLNEVKDKSKQVLTVNQENGQAIFFGLIKEFSNEVQVL